jgi:hypothetical protein
MFDYQKIEELYFSKQHTLENIEEVTGKLELNKELKAIENDGDLVTIILTELPEGQRVVEYVRRTHRGAEKDQLSFTILVD